VAGLHAALSFAFLVITSALHAVFSTDEVRSPSHHDKNVREEQRHKSESVAPHVQTYQTKGGEDVDREQQKDEFKILCALHVL
jgi:hypothetical protein